MAAILILVIFILQKTDWIIERFGLKQKRQLAEEKQNNDIDELREHAKKTDESFDKISASIEDLKKDMKDISTQVDNLQKRIDENNISKMGDRLIQGFRYYKDKQQWTTMEKWAFDNLSKAYLKSGGDSYVEDVVIPASKLWKVVDE